MQYSIWHRYDSIIVYISNRIHRAISNWQRKIIFYRKILLCSVYEAHWYLFFLACFSVELAVWSLKDLNEKDLRPEKSDHKLYLIVYAVKNTKTSQNDGSLPISRLYAGGGKALSKRQVWSRRVSWLQSLSTEFEFLYYSQVYDLGTTLGSLINLSSEKRNISPSMNLL